MPRLLLLSLLAAVAGDMLGMLQSVQSFNPRIIGGVDATIGDYPYQVSIHYNGGLACGGSIISKSWVLTAAHCVFGINPPYIQVRLGSSYSEQGGLLIDGIKRIIWHKSFNERTYNYDVALISLPTPLKLSTTVKPIGLAQSGTVVAAGKNAVVTGWGRLTADGGMSSKLQALTVPIVDQNVCKIIFSKLQNDVTDNMICAGSLTGGKDTCRGDSGGPLVYNGVQIGIVSWGYGCAKPKYPGVYTRVSAIRSWIKQEANV